METLTRTPSPTPLWTEIPNYDRHVFHPILAPQAKETEVSSTGMRSRTPSPLDREMMELHVSLKRHSLSDMPLIRHSPTSTGASSSDSKDDDMPLDFEFSTNHLFPPTKHFTPSARRCHAPTPITMMRGKSTPDMTSYMQRKQSSTQALPSVSRSDSELDAVHDFKSSLSIPVTLAKKKKNTRRRRDPPRPDGMPPLNLDVITRTASNETVNNSLLVSPRVQKPPTPRRASADLCQQVISVNFAPLTPGPDSTKALPSIQSPRSAFSTRDLIVQRS